MGHTRKNAFACKTEKKSETGKLSLMADLMTKSKIWNYVKEQLLKSMQVLSYKIYLDALTLLFEMIDDIIVGRFSLLPAKL